MFYIYKRTQSSRGARSHEISLINLIEERALLADHISTLELEATDELYTPSNMNEEVLPEVASDIGPGELFLWSYGVINWIHTIFIRNEKNENNRFTQIIEDLSKISEKALEELP